MRGKRKEETDLCEKISLECGARSAVGEQERPGRAMTTRVGRQAKL